MRTCCPTISGTYSMHTTYLFIHSPPYRENVWISNSWWRHASSGVNSIVVGINKFLEYIYIPVRISVGKISVYFIANVTLSSLYSGTFHFRISTNLKLYTFIFLHVLEISISKFFSLIRSNPERLSLYRFGIFRILENRFKCGCNGHTKFRL